jgi:hypothetical protein
LRGDFPSKFAASQFGSEVDKEDSGSEDSGSNSGSEDAGSEDKDSGDSGTEESGSEDKEPSSSSTESNSSSDNDSASTKRSSSSSGKDSGQQEEECNGGKCYHADRPQTGKNVRFEMEVNEHDDEGSVPSSICLNNEDEISVLSWGGLEILDPYDANIADIYKEFMEGLKGEPSIISLLPKNKKMWKRDPGMAREIMLRYEISNEINRKLKGKGDQVTEANIAEEVKELERKR